MGKPLPDLDVTDSIGRIHRLGLSVDMFRNSLIHLGLQYINNITGSFKNDDYNDLRETILYRLSGVIFHLNLLSNIQRHHLETIKKVRHNSLEYTNILMNSRDEQIQIFDSIIFHACSLFDYLGNLIGFICVPGKDWLNWDGVIKSSRDDSNDLSKSPVAGVVKQLDDNLVHQLYKHRSDIIHDKVDLGGAESSISPTPNESTLIVYSPKRIIKRFHQLREQSRQNELTLKYVAFWICDKTLDAIHKIIPPLLEHISNQRKTPPGSDLIIFRNPKS